MQVRGRPRQIVSSLVAAAKAHNLPPIETNEQAKQSEVWCEQRSVLGGHEAMPQEKLQENLWKQFFADTAQWWDNRESKPTPRHPDFKHKASKVPLWLNNRHKPVWVDTQLATIDAALKTNLDTKSTSLQGPGNLRAIEGNLEVSRLCKDGPIPDAVGALDALVQRGYHVPTQFFYVVLRRCIRDKDLVSGRLIHALTLRSGYEGNAFLATHLIGLYASQASLEEAMRVFTEVSTPNAHNWAAIISAYARQGDAAVAVEAIELYRRMCKSTTIRLDNRLYSAVLTACAAAKDLVAGKEVHARILASSEEPDRYVQVGLVTMYAKCGSLDDARRLFDKLPERKVVAWNAMIAGYAQNKMGQEALTLYQAMQQEGLIPDFVTFVCLLQACACVGVGALHEGKKVHRVIKDKGLQDDLVLGTSLVNMYAKCGGLEDARRVFDKLSDRNIVTWTAMIAGYTQQAMGTEALNLYRRMQQEGITPNFVTYACVLQACAAIGTGALDTGKKLHAEIQERGVKVCLVLSTSLVNMYAKCGSLGDARRLFEKLTERNIAAWNTLFAGYAQQGMGQEALCLYQRMQQEGLVRPDFVTYVCLLQACANVGVGALEDGKQLHAQIEEQGFQEHLVVATSLVNMYAKCGSSDGARRLFDKLPEKSTVAWNAMMGGYVQQGMGQEALRLYRSMQREDVTPDSVTYVCLLQACACVGVEALGECKQLHAEIREQGLEENVVLGGSLVNMYVKCGTLREARAVFDELPNRGLVTWTAMIAGYTQLGMGQEAIRLYITMQQEGLIPDSVAYTSLLQACAAAAALPLGKHLHSEIQQREMQADGLVGAALVDMYAKCGSMYESQRVFDSLSPRSGEAWGVLINGYARRGDSSAVFDLLNRMGLEGIPPNETTFLGVLTVCSHAGLVDKGREYFKTMRTNHGISATMEHFVCMVDLLGRGGYLDEAFDVAKTMPFRPNGTLWRTLLSACRKWKNLKIGEQAFKGAMSVDETDAASYVLMSNIYASTQMWEAAKELEARRLKLRAWKKPGQSWWTDMGGVMHTFLAADRMRSESEGIYARHNELPPKM